MPIALAALAPGSVRLAGELADTWAPFLWARSRVGEGRALLGEGGGGWNCEDMVPLSSSIHNESRAAIFCGNDARADNG